MKIVFKNHGLAKAGLSAAFLTDFIPGIVMTLLFGQLASMALPLRAVLGDEYSPSKLATQFENLVVVSKKKRVDDWSNVDAEIHAEKIVEDLYMLKVPSLGKFTDVIINLALESEDTKILTITDHSEVQMKVSVSEVSCEEEYERLRQQLQHLVGVSLKFDYVLPTVGDDQEEKPRFLSLGVKVPLLLNAIRAICKLEPRVSIDQIYDFWE